ncbi:hypothetical protein OHB14_30020 [Streptomyces sp. NBC_01613]|uniref:hypothetical protein n=1 Tax=Streptomyces sp. NBC_01613 TaxID=2975896 RepID=UPI00386A9D58
MTATAEAHATRRRTYGAARLLLTLTALAALFATATPAAHAAEPVAQAAYLAARLRADPVYVTDQLPREIPHSTAPAFARLAKRTGVPTYVLVLPGPSGTGKGLLGAVHDRLGRDGLYVLIDASGVSDATAYGVHAPAADAATVALYELPYDAGPLRSFERFVDVVAQGSEKAAQRAASARERYGDEDPAALYLGPSDRDNQSFLTGVLLTAVPALILLLVPYVRRWRRRLPGAKPGRPGAKPGKPGSAKLDSGRKPESGKPESGKPESGKPESGKPESGKPESGKPESGKPESGKPESGKPESGKPESGKPGPGIRHRLGRGLVPAAALAGAAAIALTASLVFDQTRSSAAPPPTAADLTARVHRVTEGLKRHSVYVDPESARVLSAAQLSRLHDRIRAFARSDGGGPVYVLLVPQLTEDESAGQYDVFTATVHRKLGKDGLYVVADPLGGYIEVLNYGLRLDSGSLDLGLPESIGCGDDQAHEADDHALGDRLDALMTYLDKVPRSDEPNTAADYPATPEPVDSHVLRPLFSGDFRPGLLMGALAALFALALTAGVLGIVGKVLRRRNPAPLPTSTLPFTAPTDPSLPYLRRTAHTELSALAEDFRGSAGSGDSGESGESGESTHEQPPSGPSGLLPHVRAWDCFDAAMLLVDGDIDALDSPGTGPETLVAVVVLSRAGRAALRGEVNDLCCGVNPLHGPAVSRHHVRVSAEGRRRRLLPVCESCRNTAIVEPATVHTLLMTLPAPAGADGRVPYIETDGPLTAVPHGIPRLIDKVRETAGVQ